MNKKSYTFALALVNWTLQFLGAYSNLSNGNGGYMVHFLF